MEEVIRFFRTYELWVYMILGLGGLIYLRKFTLAWQELRGATFGLERESAQARLNRAAIMLVLLLAIAMTEFVLVSFIAPSMPETLPLPTTTLDLLATATTTLLAETPQASLFATAATPTGAPLGQATASLCMPGQVEITSPRDGSEIGGVVPITGTVNIPNFGFYKLEMKRPEETNWLTILAGNEVKQQGTLGAWNTSLLPPGNYQLSLVATDNQGQSLPACIIQVRVASPAETPGP